MNEFYLKELLEIKNGRDHKHLSDGNIPIYGSGGLMRFGDHFIYDKESILLPRKGTLSNIQFVKKPFWTVDTLYYTVINKEKANPYFLYHYLKLLDLSNLNSGTGVPSMTFGAYYGVKLQIPDLQIQNKIAAVLSVLDDKIELNNQINSEMEAMAKTLYDYWFVQFDFPFDSAQGESDVVSTGSTTGDSDAEPVEATGITSGASGTRGYKSSGGKMVYNEALKREIPEGWEVKTIGDYCKSTGGFAFKSSWWSDKGSAVIKIKDIREDYSIDLSDLSSADLSGRTIDKKFISKPGDVLIAMTGATVGKYAIVPFTKFPLFVNQRVGYFNLGENPTSKLPFLINSLNQKYFRETVFTLASGAAQPNISNEQINNIPLLVPSKDLIIIFNESLKSVYDKILLNQKQNQELAQLRDWLLPMLMNGQVTVGEIEEKMGMVAEEKGKYQKT